MNTGLNWIPWISHQGIPPAAVYAGYDKDGSPIYIGRAYHAGDQLPAKVIPSKRTASVAYYGLEHVMPHFEVLTGTGFSWVGSGNGHVPAGAVYGGRTKTGEILYVGRAYHESSLIPGKIHPSHKKLYIPYGGKEISVKNYEVLIQQ
uniref:Uncharacterized protein n=1 Tax=Anopheles culicifacies TaxID=139723 RepID=A0A182MW78_9DIPT